MASPRRRKSGSNLVLGGEGHIAIITDSYGADGAVTATGDGSGHTQATTTCATVAGDLHSTAVIPLGKTAVLAIPA